MFEGQYLISNGSDEVVLSPWFPRQGDNCTFTVETIQNGGASISISVLTKNSEDAGNGSASGTTISVPAAGTASATATGALLELVRYEFTVSGTKGDFKLFRMLSPVWRDAV